ncbi:phosphate transporter [Citrus sinensis]|nr:phosphate transporter [Citrus sinensis]
MPADSEKIPVEFAVQVVGKWKETYQWVPVLGGFAAFAMAFSAGANNLPAPFSTALGSGTLTLLKASIMAGLIYVPGAALASNSTFIKENQPSEGFLMWTIWLVIATYFELPVSPQQATQAALLGSMLVTEGFDYIPLWNKNDNHNFNGGGLLWIFLEWTVAPLFACMCACFLFILLKVRGHLVHIPRWVTIAAVALATFIGAVLPLVVIVPLATKELGATEKHKTAKNNNMNSTKEQCVEIQDQTCSNNTKGGDDEAEDVLREFMQRRVLDTVYEEEERNSCASPDSTIKDSDQQLALSTGQSTQFKHLLQCTPNNLVQTKTFHKMENQSPFQSAYNFVRNFTKSTVSPVIEYDRNTLIRHALAEKYDEIEDCFSVPHLLASCIFALIQSVSEIAAIVSPYGAIVDIFNNRAKYSGNGEDVDSIDVSWWFRALGGLGAVMGFILCGWKLTQCLGGKLTYMSNSRGLASQLSTVAAVIIVSTTNLPVSTVHAFVGSLVGVGIADDIQNVNWKLLFKFICGWVMTIIFCCGAAFAIFYASVHVPAYAVP